MIKTARKKKEINSRTIRRISWSKKSTNLRLENSTGNVTFETVVKFLMR
jgi:HTH-type transcriptional regulator/antitoxin HipB